MSDEESTPVDYSINNSENDTLENNIVFSLPDVGHLEVPSRKINTDEHSEFESTVFDQKDSDGDMSNHLIYWGMHEDSLQFTGETIDENSEVFSPAFCEITEVAVNTDLKFRNIEVGSDFRCLWCPGEKGIYVFGTSRIFTGFQFEDSIIRDVSAGENHLVVVLNHGAMYSIGYNEYGQCGVEICEFSVLQRIGNKYQKFVKVECGEYYTLALTKQGEVVGFGLGYDSQPKSLLELFAIPVAFIACGSSHAMVLTVDGVVFSWGRNRYGQLGLGHTDDVYSPTEVYNHSTIIQIGCGTIHSGMLCDDHSLYTFGSNQYGQCGIGNLLPSIITSPRKIENKLIFSFSCGNYHTIFLSTEKKLFGFGRNHKFQCIPFIESPTIVSPTFIHIDYSEHIEAVTASRFCSYIILLNEYTEFEIDEEYYNIERRPPIFNLDLPRVETLCRVAINTGDYGRLSHILTRTFSSCSCINASFLRPSRVLLENSCPVNIEEVIKFFRLISSLNVIEIDNRLTKSIVKVTKKILKNQVYLNNPIMLRFFFILFMNPHIWNPSASKRMLSTLNRTWIKLSPDMKLWLIRIYAHCDIDTLRYLVKNLKFGASDLLESVGRLNESIILCIKVTNELYKANEIRKSIGLESLQINEFRSPLLTRSKYINLNKEFLKWFKPILESQKDMFSLCQYPWILDTSAKEEILHNEVVLRMKESAILLPFFHGAYILPGYSLPIRRSHIRKDTMDKLLHIMLHNPHILTWTMKVKFVDEEGDDEGGILKEFFMLIIPELIKEEFGMFVFNNETNTYWFDGNCKNSLDDYKLIGLIIGLGLYHSVNLNVHFPYIVYMKLCKETQTFGFRHLKYLDLELFRNLEVLLKYENDDFEEIFGLNFTLSIDRLGNIDTIELIENGSNINVTKGNRKEYVELYAFYLLNTSVEKQFEAFKEGFLAVLKGKALSLLEAYDLEVLVCGNPNLALQAKTEYSGGFSADSQVIQWFWEILYDYSLESKKKLLFFTTGSDRAPLRGLGSLKFTIQHAGGNTSQLPTAHTCFNTLLLPNYDNKQDLDVKLERAIEHSQGRFWKWTSQQRPHWKDNKLEAVVIFTVFGITGSSSMFLTRPLVSKTLGLEGSIIEGPWSYRVMSILLISPVYAVLLITFGTLAGRHVYFAGMSKKILSRFIPASKWIPKGCTITNWTRNNGV